MSPSEINQQMLAALKDAVEAIKIQQNSPGIALQLNTDFLESVIAKAEVFSNPEVLQLVQICQNEKKWAILCTFPHPEGKKHPFNHRPYTLGDYAWGMTASGSWAKEALPKVLAALASVKR